jgi:hypothetical protein
LFGSIVGGLNSLVAKESEEVLPVFEQSSCPCTHGVIGAVLVVEAKLFDAASNEGSGPPELFVGKIALFKGMPIGEQITDFLEHVFGKQIGIGAASHLL